MSATLLDEIVALAGVTPTVRLCRTFGGRLVYVPERMTETHPLALCMGLEPASELARRYGGERITMPAELCALRELRDRLIAQQYQDDERSVSWLSREYGVSRKWVTVILDRAGVKRRALDEGGDED